MVLARVNHGTAQIDSRPAQGTVLAKTHERYRGSGLSQAEFCKRENLNANTFSSWKKIIEERNAEAAAAQDAKLDTFPFVNVVAQAQRVEAPPPPLNLAVAEIDLVRRTVRIFNGATAETLRAILTAVKESTA